MLILYFQSRELSHIIVFGIVSTFSVYKMYIYFEMRDFNKKKYSSGFTLGTFIFQLLYFCCDASVTMGRISIML